MLNLLNSCFTFYIKILFFEFEEWKEILKSLFFHAPNFNDNCYPASGLSNWNFWT